MARLPSAVVLVLFAAAAATVRISRKELNWVLIGTIAGGCAAGAYSVKQYLSGQYYHSLTSGRTLWQWAAVLSIRTFLPPVCFCLWLWRSAIF